MYLPSPTLRQPVPPPIWLGFGLAASFCGLVVLIVVQGLLVDLGGWAGVGLAAAIVVAVGGSAALALWRPVSAVVVLGVGSLVPVGFGLAAFIDFEALSAWEDTHGPWQLVTLAVIAGPLAVAGLTHPRVSGLLMVVVALSSAVLPVLGADSAWVRALALAPPALAVAAAGACYLWGSRTSRETQESTDLSRG